MPAVYFEEADVARLLHEYPIGEAFLRGPARLSTHSLRSLQEQRFAALMRRGWQIPFYRRRWAAAGIEPGDITRLDDLARLPRPSRSRT